MNLPLVGVYDYWLVALSVLIAVIAAYIALELAGQVSTALGGARQAWLCGSAAAFAAGIRDSHNIGMQAFHLPIPVLYDWPTELLSLFIAMLGSGVALFTVSRITWGRARWIAGGIALGGGIAAMHYVGMEAMRLRAMCVFTPWLVAVSILITIILSMAALQQAFLLPKMRTSGWRRFNCTAMLVLAVAVTHYAGMAAVHFIPTPSITDHGLVNVGSVGLAGIGVMALLLGLMTLWSMVDRRFSLQERQFADNLVDLQAVFHTMTEAIVVVDGERGLVQHNLAACALFGLESRGISLQEMTGSFDGFSPTGEPLRPEEWPIMRAMHGDFCKNVEVTMRRKDTGETVAAEISTVPIATHGYDGRKFIVSLRDVRERKQMDETRSRLAAIVESSEDAIISMTDHGIIQSWNRGAERLHGFIAEEMIGQSISLVIPEGKADEENETFERILRGETVEPYETIRKHKSGKSIDVSLTISPIRDGSGKIVGASKIARNITERKNLERQLHQSRRMEAIGQLTSGIAHDFNNLLCVIQGNLGLLEPLLKDNVVALKRVRTAKKASARGADVIRRLMSFSSNAELKAAPGSLNESVRNLVEWSPALGPDIKIATDLNELMPPVFVDAAGLESALLNLAVNARDAMPKGGTLTITTNLTTLEEDYPPVLTGELKAGRYAYISISDTGHGMSQETLERVFEPFFTTKPRNKGTGLGLAMVYGFAKQSKGAARIYSEIDYGTTVTLYLPLAEETPEPVLARELGHTPAKVSGAVLVVDDEEDLVEIARAFLEEMGYTTYHARDGASALAVVEQHNDIDLIVTDILMPGGMNGVELTEKIRESLEQVKVIYCSGFPANALAERNMSLIDGPLLLKPYQRAEFTTAVRAVMDAPR